MLFTNEAYFSTSPTRARMDTASASEGQLTTPSSLTSAHLTLLPCSSASWMDGNVKDGLDLLRQRGE